MKSSNCEHELFQSDEDWFSDTAFIITLKCEKCGKRFQGTVIEQNE